MDTSFILLMLEQRRDMDEELHDLVKGKVRIATLDSVERELQRIARTRASSVGGFASAALELMRKRKYGIYRSGIDSSHVDADILSFAVAQSDPIAVATVDRKLRSSLNKFGLRVIYPMRHRGLMMSASST